MQPGNRNLREFSLDRAHNAWRKWQDMRDRQWLVLGGLELILRSSEYLKRGALDGSCPEGG